MSVGIERIYAKRKIILTKLSKIKLRKQIFKAPGIKNHPGAFAVDTKQESSTENYRVVCITWTVCSYEIRETI